MPRGRDSRYDPARQVGRGASMSRLKWHRGEIEDEDLPVPEDGPDPRPPLEE